MGYKRIAFVMFTYFVSVYGFGIKDIADYFLGGGYGQYPNYPGQYPSGQQGNYPGNQGLYPVGQGSYPGNYPGQYPGSNYLEHQHGGQYPGQYPNGPTGGVGHYPSGPTGGAGHYPGGPTGGVGHYPGGPTGGVGHYPTGTNPGVVGPPGAHPGCPLCDSSVYSYCSHKQVHDACCCDNPAYLPFNCRKSDCKTLYANSCNEYNLITRCCCVDLQRQAAANAVQG